MADQEGATAAREAHPHTQKLRKGFQAYSRGDLSAISELFADDATIHILSDSSPFAGVHKGKDGLRQLFEKTRGALEEESWTVEDLMVNDDYVVAITRAQGTKKQGRGHGPRSGGTMDVQVFRMRNGRVTKAWYINDDPNLEDREFWSA